MSHQHLRLMVLAIGIVVWGGCSAPRPTIENPTASAMLTAAASSLQTATPTSGATSAPATVPATQAPNTATPTNSPMPTATATATPTPEFTSTTKLRANIYSGPGTNYTLLGNLSSGLTVRVTGRNANKSWWQIDFPSAPGGHGWVAASTIGMSAGAVTDSVPTVNAPPTPTRSPFTRPAATATRTGIAALRADRSQLNPGECTTLRWNVDNVQSVYLDLGNGEVPVVGHDTTSICPDSTRTYVLRTLNTNGTSSRYTFTVNVSETCGNTPVISRFEASADEITVGGTVTLSWDVSCAQSVYFKEDAGSSKRQPVTGHDEITLTLNQTRTCRLIAVGRDGTEVKQEITINVTD